MDMLNKAKGMMGNQSGNSNTTGGAMGGNQNMNTAQGGAGQEDYGDKGTHPPPTLTSLV